MPAETAHYAECFPQILTIQQDVAALQCRRVVLFFFSDIVSELFNVVALETGVRAAAERGRSYKAAEHRRCGWVGLNTRDLTPGFGSRDDSSRSVRKAGRVMPRHLAPLHTCAWDTVRKSNRREREARPHDPHLFLHRAPLFGPCAELQEKISDMTHVRAGGRGRTHTSCGRRVCERADTSSHTHVHMKTDK